jgi:uncharacterized protein YigA (DUF484 family)
MVRPELPETLSMVATKSITRDVARDALSPSEKQSEKSNPLETEQQVMMRRLWKSDELIKQLKHIVKAQHGKIEELRERLEFEPAGMVRAQMAAQDMTNFARMKEDNAELRRSLLRVQGDLKKERAETANFRQVNNRLKRMLQEQQPLLQLSQPEQNSHASFIEDDPDSPLCPQYLKFTGLEDLLVGMGDSIGSALEYTPNKSVADTPMTPRTARSAPAAFGQSQSLNSTAGTVFAHAATAPSGAMMRSARGSPGKRPFTASGVSHTSDGKLPPFCKLWRLGSLVPMFWRDLSGPTSVLKTLVEITGRLLEDAPSASITVYMLDPWLRNAATTKTKEKEPALFYIGGGKTTVQVFHSDGGARAEPPKFGDLHALPVRSRTALAVGVQLPTSHRKVAMVQVLSTEESADPNAVTQSKFVKALSTRSSPDKEAGLTGFTDSQLMYLQLVCNVAGGILEQVKQNESKVKLLDRVRSCVDISVAINQARSLPDFEQRVKHLIGQFFNVTTVRVLFYEPETNELLISSAQMKRKGVSRLCLDKGVVGHCATRQTLVNVSNISHHPYIDACADGLQRSGRPVASDAAMLVGPMVIETVDGPRLVGLIQLLERKRQKSGKAPPPQGAQTGEEFTQDEVSLFTQLLRTSSQTAWRTLQVEELTAQVNNGHSGLIHMLAG